MAQHTLTSFVRRSLLRLGWTVPAVALGVVTLGVAVLGVAVLTVPPALAQNEPTSIFIDRVDVNVINVEVVVTDKAGHRVTDLGADEFELLEDDEPAEISNFYSVARADQVLTGLERDRTMLGEEPGAAKGEAMKAVPVPREQQLNLLVYVDHFNLRPQNQKRVLDQLGAFLEERASQGDNIMLVGYNRKVEVVQPFTRDYSLIATGIKKLAKTATYGQVDDVQRIQTMKRKMPPPPSLANTPSDSIQASFTYLRSYVQQVQSDLRSSTRALGSVVRSLSGLPGRKAILYVSDGLPQRPGEELFQYLDDIYATALNSAGIDPVIESLREDESQLFNEITRHANAHQVTFYTLDARGPSGGSSLSAEYEDLSVGAGGHTTFDNIRRTNYQEPLIDMAEATGGASILNTFNFDGAFAELGTDFDSFYSLGYRSRHGGDGKYHKIEVRVKRPGLTVRHRTGYVDKPEGERVADRTLSSLLLDLEANPLGVAVDFGTPEKKGRSYMLPLLVRIPVDQVTLLPNGDAQQGRLKIFLVVQDEKGGVSDLAEIPYPISIPTAQIAEAGGREIGYRTNLKIGEGLPKVAVAVWDELSGTESYVHKRVRVGKVKERQEARRGR